MYNHKIKTSFFSPEVPTAVAKKTGFNLIIVHFISAEFVYNTMREMFFNVFLQDPFNVLLDKITK